METIEYKRINKIEGHMLRITSKSRDSQEYEADKERQKRLRKLAKIYKAYKTHTECIVLCRTNCQSVELNNRIDQKVVALYSANGNKFYRRT